MFHLKLEIQINFDKKEEAIYESSIGFASETLIATNRQLLYICAKLIK
jgi:hypothetical protein